MTGCKSRIKINLHGSFDMCYNEHNHERPPGERNVKLKYGFIPTPKGRHLLMLEGYTYSQMCTSRLHFICSKKSAGCMSRVKINDEGALYAYFREHNHERPKYIISNSGEYVRVR